jgi:hypothetical protein
MFIGVSEYSKNALINEFGSQIKKYKLLYPTELIPTNTFKNRFLNIKEIYNYLSFAPRQEFKM